MTWPAAGGAAVPAAAQSVTEPATNPGASVLTMITLPSHVMGPTQRGIVSDVSPVKAQISRTGCHEPFRFSLPRPPLRKASAVADDRPTAQLMPPHSQRARSE